MLELMRRLDAKLTAITLGPKYDMFPGFGWDYDIRMRSILKKTILLKEFKEQFDTCGLEEAYDHTKHICTDPDNPLYYFQVEFLVDVLTDQPEPDLNVHTTFFPKPENITPPHRVHTGSEDDGLHFCIDEWSEAAAPFWNSWVREEMLANVNDRLTAFGSLARDGSEMVRWRKNSDGAATFAQDLIWYAQRFRHGRVGAGEHFYIAYISTDRDTLSTQSVVMAVGVFVAEESLYSTMGITKSFRLDMCDTMHAERWMLEVGFTSQELEAQIQLLKSTRGKLKGSSAIKMHEFVANFVAERFPSNKGLFFRPNGVMRKLMVQNFADYDIGSDKDAINRKWITENKLASMDPDCTDCTPSILQRPANVVIRQEQPLPHPFWEPPSAFPHPDYFLNMHLPLMFVPIQQMRSRAPKQIAQQVEIARKHFKHNAKWRKELLERIATIKSSRGLSVHTLFSIDDLRDPTAATKATESILLAVFEGATITQTDKKHELAHDGFTYSIRFEDTRVTIQRMPEDKYMIYLPDTQMTDLVWESPLHSMVDDN